MMPGLSVYEPPPLQCSLVHKIDLLGVDDQKIAGSSQYFLDNIVFVEFAKFREIVVLAELGGRNEVTLKDDHPDIRPYRGDLFPGWGPCGGIVLEWHIADAWPSALPDRVLKQEHVQYAV